jgi:hypothetical protein
MAAIAVALGILSQRFTGWRGDGLALGATVMALLAVDAFWQSWMRRG